MQPYFGLNVANTKPFNPDGGSPSFKTEDDWRTTFSLIKGTFPKTNAVRIYSTTDNGKYPLMDAIPAAKENNLRILVGVWSGGPTVTARFDQEIQALGQVVDQYGCDNFAAVSVGNEDLNYINVPGMDTKVMSGQKIATTDLLVDQIGQVRKMLRDKGCCNTPVTHTDTWNELTNKDNPSINKVRPSVLRSNLELTCNQVIQACDQAVIANIFPYWGNATVIKAWEMAADQSTLTLEAVKQYGKDLWLGETGWARSQQVSADVPACTTHLEHANNLDRITRTSMERTVRMHRPTSTSWAARLFVGMALASITSTGTRTHLRNRNRALACWTSTVSRRMAWTSVALVLSRICISDPRCPSSWAARVLAGNSEAFLVAGLLLVE